MAEEAIREVRASGLDYLRLATRLLRRVRLADAEAGLWEAADLQWWWRTARSTSRAGAAPLSSTSVHTELCASQNRADAHNRGASVRSRTGPEKVCAMAA